MIRIFHKQVRELARSAGEAILAIYTRFDKNDRETLPVISKADGSPLSLADSAAHQIIYNGLEKINSAIPIVSEEDPSSHQQQVPYEMFWLVDPLDGTKEFLAGSNEFTVNIAFVHNGEPVWGVVFAPALDRMYWGGRNFGAYREHAGHIETISVTPPPAPGTKYRVMTSKRHLNKETIEFLANLGDMELIQAGSSLKFCRIAEGFADIYPRLGPTCEWDTAAAQAIVEGAGGVVVTLEGKPLQYGKTEVLNPYFIAASTLFKSLRL